MVRSLGKYVAARQVADGVWQVVNKRHGDLLGGVEYYAPWRCYVFQPSDDAAFSADCLQDIANFLATLKDERSKARTAGPGATREGA